jgi:autotransporter-associated beta strand protein/T5SS/PEP-CTERM-associated repeat protein
MPRWAKKETIDRWLRKSNSAIAWLAASLPPNDAKSVRAESRLSGGLRVQEIRTCRVAGITLVAANHCSGRWGHRGLVISKRGSPARLRRALLGTSALVCASVAVLEPTSASAQQYFDDNQTVQNGAIDGGGGPWDTTTTNWTNSTGSANAAYDPTAGTVTVFGRSVTSIPASAGTVTVQGAGIQLTSMVEFRGTGDFTTYTITGGDLTLAGGGTTFDLAANATISSNIIGSGGLTKSSVDALTLAGTNTYTGATSINGGRLVAASDTALPSATDVTVTSFGTLEIGDGVFADINSLSGNASVVIGTVDPTTTLFIGFAGGATTTFSGGITGAGSLELDGGSLTLTGISAIGGDVTICDCATLTLDGATASFTTATQASVDGILNVQNGATLNADVLEIAGTATVTGAHTSVTVTDATVVGTAFSTGASLTISAGAALTTFDLVANGDASQLTIDGANTTVTATGMTIVGGPFGGTAPTATISDGATVNSQGGGFIEGFDNLPQMTVTGAGSTWNVDNGLFVGGFFFGGPGSLVVGSGGAVNVTGGTLIGGDPSLGLGPSTLTVTGANSVLTTDTLQIGLPPCGCGDLAGTLTVADGGRVSATGGTTIHTLGVLNLGIGGLAGTFESPTIVNDGQIVANFTDTLTLAAAISGTGTLTKQGTGVLTLTGNSSYTGGTTLHAGTLRVENDNALGTGTLTALGGALDIQNGRTIGNAIDLQANLTVNVDAGPFATYSGNIGETGGAFGLTKTGAGALTLPGSNTYTGGTILSAGTLRVENDNALGTGTLTALGGTLDIQNGRTIGNAMDLQANLSLNVDAGPFATYSGAIGETGGAFGITKTGGGTLNLTGNNVYTGATHVNAGTLVAGSSTAFSHQSAFTVGAGATLEVSDGGVLAGIGSLAGAGNVLIGGGGSSLTVGLNNQSTTFSGIISGNGSLTKQGTGVLTLPGTSTYTGATVVDAGGLIVNGSIASSSGLTVNGGFVGGTGTLPSTTIAGGALSPGNSIGTINIGGNLTFLAAGTYIVEVSPTAADRTNVTGTANLAGTVHALFLPGSYLQRTYTIVSAASVTGAFNTLTTTDLPAGFTSSLSYSGTEAILNLTAVLGLQAIPPGGLNINQRNVATSLNTFFNNGGVLPPDFVTVFGLTGSGLANGLTQLAGEIGTGAATAGFRAQDQFLNLMLDPFLENRAGGAVANGAGAPALSFTPVGEADSALAFAKGLPRKAPPLAPSFEQRWSVWGAGYGGHGSFDGDTVIGSNDLRVNTAGVAGGVDYRFGQSVIGAAVTGQSLSYRLDSAPGSGSGDAVQGGLYGSTKWGNAYLSAAVSFGWFDLDTTRSVLLPGVANVLTGNVSADSFGGRIEGGWRVPVWQSSGVTPYAALQALRFHTDAYTETGAAGGNAFALAYAANTTNDVRSELGLRVDSRMLVNETTMLILRGRAAWAHAFDTDRAINPFFVNLPGAGFTVFGATPAENAALLSAGGELRFGNGFSALAKFDAELGGDATAYSGSGTLRYSW